MSLRLFDGLSKAKVAIEAPGGELALYVCGESPHEAPTLEAARTAVFFDSLRRHLGKAGVRVRSASAWMDTDERVVARAQLDGTTPRAVADRFIPVHEAMMRRLGVAPPDACPRAADRFDAALALAGRLVDAGLAYATPAGLAFRTRSYPDYGRLSGQRREMLLQSDEPGGRLADPLDFLIFQATPADAPFARPTRFGFGRPTWHLECPALSTGLLPGPIDLHGGCADLLFPHHENSRALVESLGAGTFARRFIHTGAVTLTAKDAEAGTARLFLLPVLFERFDPLDVRFYLLSHLYRNPMSFEPERIADVAQSRRKLAGFVKELAAGGDGRPPEELGAVCGSAFEALDDDFNAPRALGLVHVLRKRIRAVPGYPALPYGRRLAGCLTALLKTVLGVIE